MADMKHNPLPRQLETARHGSNATAQRPNTAGAVYWYGSVTPLNAQPGDLLAINGTLSVVTAPIDVGSPLVWWDFRQYDGSGQLAPRIGTDLLTILGTPGYVAGSHVLFGATGKYGKAADAAKWDPETTGTLTVVVVAANDGYSGNGKTRWYVTHRVDGATAGWSLQRNAASPYRMELVTRDGVSAQTLNVSDTPATTTFRGRGAVITPAGTHRLWGNGTTSSAPSTVTGSHGNTAPLVVGNSHDSPSFVGLSAETKMRGVLIYSTALTDQQISDYATAAGAGTT
jgi:hypothetical protein